MESSVWRCNNLHISKQHLTTKCIAWCTRKGLCKSAKGVPLILLNPVKFLNVANNYSFVTEFCHQWYLARPTNYSEKSKIIIIKCTLVRKLLLLTKQLKRRTIKQLSSQRPLTMLYAKTTTGARKKYESFSKYEHTGDDVQHWQQFFSTSFCRDL